MFLYLTLKQKYDTLKNCCVDASLHTNIYECGNSNECRLQLSYHSCTPDTGSVIRVIFR